MLSSLAKASCSVRTRTLLQSQTRGPLASQLRTMFIQTEDTPNPESLKFLPGREVLETTDEITGFYAIKSDSEAISRSPLTKTLFTVDGVKSVYLGGDFVTITKYAEHPWGHVKTRVFSAIMDHYASGKPAVSEMAEVTDTTIYDDDDEVVAMIKELLETRIRPAVQEDGGDIHYIGFAEETGIVTVKLAGSCVGCPSSSVTLKQGVENMLMHYIPEVTAVVSQEEEDEDVGGPPPAVDEVQKQQKTYEERLASAGIPFSD
jgi:Fe-S cluster biogenesis protein NfuA